MEVFLPSHTNSLTRNSITFLVFCQRYSIYNQKYEGYQMCEGHACFFLYLLCCMKFSMSQPRATFSMKPSFILSPSKVDQPFLQSLYLLISLNLSEYHNSLFMDLGPLRYPTLDGTFQTGVASNSSWYPGAEPRVGAP